MAINYSPICPTLKHDEFRVNALEIYQEFQECQNYHSSIRNDTVVNKIVAMAKMRELQNEK